MLRCTVITCTDSASDSRRRLRSSVWSAAASDIRCCSHSTIEATPNFSSVAAVCSTWPMCRRSVSRRSPCSRASTRATIPRPVASSRAATPRRDSSSPHSCSSALSSSKPVSSSRASIAGRPADEAGQRRRARQSLPLRLLERAEQREPVVGRVGEEHAGGAGEHDRHPGRLERVADEARLLVAVDEHGDVARSHRTRARCVVEGGARGEQPGDVGGDVAGDVRTHRGHRRHRVPPRREGLALDDPQPERCGSPGEPAAGTRRRDRVYDDPVVAERDTAHHVLERVEQRAVAAPVGAERGGAVGPLGGDEVGHDVGAAEGVDRLLGVADEHHGPLAVEGALEDLPLHRVGVLELVDHHHGVPAADPGPRRRPGRRVDQRVAQVHQQVVVVHQPAAALAELDLGAGRVGEPAPHVGLGARLGVPRLEACEPVADGVPAELDRGRQVERRLGAVRSAVGAQVEVGDHLGGHVGGVLGEGQVGVDVGGDAEPGEHLQAEPVGRGDGGGVEVGDRVREPVASRRDLGVAAGREVHQHGVVGRPRRRRIRERRGRGDEPLADALTQLDRRGPAERHQHQLVDAGHTLGDVARGQRGDRVRLAGAGAGLQHRRPGRQVPARVEDGPAHECIPSCSSSGPNTWRAS